MGSQRLFGIPRQVERASPPTRAVALVAVVLLSACGIAATPTPSSPPTPTPAEAAGLDCAGQVVSGDIDRFAGTPIESHCGPPGRVRGPTDDGRGCPWLVRGTAGGGRDARPASRVHRQLRPGRSHLSIHGLRGGGHQTERHVDDPPGMVARGPGLSAGCRSTPTTAARRCLVSCSSGTPCVVRQRKPAARGSSSSPAAHRAK